MVALVEVVDALWSPPVEELSTCPWVQQCGNCLQRVLHMEKIERSHSAWPVKVGFQMSKWYLNNGHRTAKRKNWKKSSKRVEENRRRL